MEGAEDRIQIFDSRDTVCVVEFVDIETKVIEPN